MGIKFFCTNCGQKLEAEDNQLGQEFPCPGCKTTINTPEKDYASNTPVTADQNFITIAKDGESFGPFSIDQINSLLKEGKILPTDLAWKEGEVDWKTLSELLGGSFPKNEETRIYVGNLPFNATENDIQKLFEVLAPILKIEICRNPKTNHSKGYGYVLFATVEEASKAIIAYHDKEFMGHRLIVAGANASPEGYIAEPKHVDEEIITTSENPKKIPWSFKSLFTSKPTSSKIDPDSEDVLFRVNKLDVTKALLDKFNKEWNFSRPPSIQESQIAINFIKNLVKKFNSKPAFFYLGPPQSIIPGEILSEAINNYLQLQEDELLLAVYDSTIFKKDASTGFALTTKRIYWKDLWEAPRCMEYAYISGPVGYEPNKLILGEGFTITIRDDARVLLTNLPAFLKIAARVYGSPVQLIGELPEIEDIDALLKPHLDKLDKLIGLSRVKNDLKALTNSAKINQIRKAQGLKTPSPSLHMVFSGGPGTGKTTVARLIGHIYRSLGILKKGHCIEVSRADLVAGYVGQTALKTTEKLHEAIGGVLFIDEAYALLDAKESSHRWGQESIDTILKFMEDHRNELVVIVAGYSHEMTKFISSNPGLESRFTNHLFFENYTPDELVAIFLGYCKESDYNLATGVEEQLMLLFEKAYKHRDQRFSNARYVRTVFEKTISNQAKRLIELQCPNQDSLREIRSVDITESNIGKKRANRPKKTDQDLKAIEEAWRNIAIESNVKNRLISLAQHFDEGSESASKGLLLYGPPGTGKTMIAKTLAESMGCDFFPLSLPDLKGGFTGQSGQMVKELWERALAQPMSVLFVDECEGVFGRRGSNDSDKLSEEIVQSFLAQWDGFTKQNTVWVIGATNRRDLIDPAILSRFGEEVQIGLPNEVQRLEILEKELEKRNISSKIPAESSILTQGLSGRDLASLAGRLARELQGAQITAKVMEHYTSEFRKQGSTQTDKNATWEKLVLSNLVLKDLKTTAGLLEHAESFTKRGINVPRGLMLYGPPGTGKTQIARTLANETGLKFLGASTADIKAGFVGQSGQKVRELFERARESAPCLLFLDELDIVAPSRDGLKGIDQFTQEIVGQLLQEMDGVNAHPQPIFVLAASNRLDQIDSAILSRFPKKIEIPLPDRDGREQLLRTMLESKPIAFDLDQASIQLALIGEGLSGRDIRSWIEQAEQNAVGRAIESGDPDSVSITLEDFPLMEGI